MQVSVSFKYVNGAKKRVEDQRVSVIHPKSILRTRGKCNGVTLLRSEDGQLNKIGRREKLLENGCMNENGLENLSFYQGLFDVSFIQEGLFKQKNYALEIKFQPTYNLQDFYSGFKVGNRLLTPYGRHFHTGYVIFIVIH